MANRYIISHDKPIAYMKHFIDTDAVLCGFTDGSTERIDVDELSNRIAVQIQQSNDFTVTRSVSGRYVLYNGFNGQQGGSTGAGANGTENGTGNGGGGEETNFTFTDSNEFAI